MLPAVLANSWKQRETGDLDGMENWVCSYRAPPQSSPDPLPQQSRESHGSLTGLPPFGKPSSPR